MTLHRLRNDSRPYALYTFLLTFLLASLVVIPVMIKDHGYFLYYGDFNVQQIPFYQLAHDSIRSGNIGWSHLTDLGANFIGSYSFYLLGSPFFWLTVLLPSAWVPYTFGPLIALKLACASLSAYLYIRRYVRDRKYAVIGGILYAFSGFSIYNIFFFHFHEAMIVFPLLLAALDEFHATGRKGIMALAVFAAATVNYYFFFGQVVFVVIYYFVKLACRSYRFRIRDFIALAIECVLGFCLSMFLLLPSVAAIVGNYRVSQVINGWNALIYPHTQRYIQIFVSLFFPGDVPARNNFTASAGAKWSSVAAYLPMFSMVFVIAQLRNKQHGFFKRMIVILLVMAAIPALNSAFQCMNSSYYARWFYMLTLMTSLVTVQSLNEMKDIRFARGFYPTAAVTLVTALLIGLTPMKTESDTGEEALQIGLEESTKHFWYFVIMTVIGLMLTYIIYLIYQKKPRFFYRSALVLLSVFVVGYSSVYIWSARIYADRDDDFMMSYALNHGEDITLSDIDEVRSDFYNTSDNLGMYWQVPTIQAFHSIVPGSLINFYNNVGVTRDVGSRPEVTYYGLRGLLSVKYLFVEEDPESPENKHYTDLMPDYRYVDTENGFDIYENQYYIPMGFTFSQYITEDEFNDLSTGAKHLALLKALVLTQDQMEKHADITGYTDGMFQGLNAYHEDHELQNVMHPGYPDYDSLLSDFDYSENTYREDTTLLQSNSCSSFTYTKEGFTAEFNNSGDDNLLFFSVPYDDGWTAYVNGEPSEIEQVDIGFMAVRVPGHTASTVIFRYQTPMLREGCIISAMSLGVFIIYLIINRGFGGKRRSRKTYRIKGTTKQKSSS